MSAIRKRSCPDCEGSMKQIKIIDKTVSRVFSIPEQTELEYVEPGGKKNFITGEQPISGRVCVLMCNRCNRILLYGQPSGI